jgi:photosystem II stability/assembly factor-like uncharacterized protein
MSRSVLSIVNFLVVLSLALPQCALAGTNRWTRHGPEGGSVIALAVDPGNDMVVYAGTEAGVYKTENGGESWTAINEGMPEEVVSALAVSLADHSTVFAGTREGKVFKSVDAGQHWAALSIPENPGVRSLAITPQAVYAGTERGLLESHDGGATWEAASSPLPAARVNFLTLTPEGLLFAGIDSSLYVSWNGKKWRTVKNAFNPLAMALGPDRSLYSATPVSIMRSVDFGNTWKRVTALPMQQTSPTSLLVSDNGRVTLGTPEGLWEWENEEWTHSIPGNINTLAAGSPPSTRTYAGVAISGAFTRADSSAEWVSVNRGIETAETTDVVVAPFSPSTVYAAMPTGVSRSSDGGNSWSTVESNPTRAVAIDSHNPNVVFAAQHSLKKTDDGGETWKIVRPNLPMAIAVAPSNPSVVYAALSDDMAKSTDGGETWSGISGNGLPFFYSYYGYYYYGVSTASVTVAPSDPATVFLGQYDALYRTIDGGSSWKAVSPMGDVSVVAIDPFSSSIVYAVITAKGTSVSQDGGVTWASLGLADEEVTSIVVDPASATVLYAATRDGDVYRRDDRGGGWVGFSEGLSGAEIRRLSIDATGKFIYAATSAGVFTYQVSDESESPPGN